MGPDLEINGYYLSLTFFLVLLNGFFVAAEFAMVRVRGSQIEIKAKAGSRTAKIAKVVCICIFRNAVELNVLRIGTEGELHVSGRERISVPRT